ncbi:MAG: reverse transcriptase domain-containing protein [Chloroflexota bacterium]|nr:reverse transcriptase domain-containing protein [Chloroflexota bacterium]
MAEDIRLQELFSPDHLRQAFFDYKEQKTDFFDPDQISIRMGADGVSPEAFEKQLDRNVANISKKVLAGAYLFYPFREIEVLKPDGGKRILAIASIRDVLVQQQLYKFIYPLCEKLFELHSVDQVSFAYRKNFSAPQAALYVREFLNAGYCYALDADIVKYFDSIPHERLFLLLESLLGTNTLAYKQVRRFILTDKVPYQSYMHRRHGKLVGKEVFRKIKPKRQRREQGIPQGGILSGMLANLYLHEFDRWLMESVRKQIDLRYVRYADDFIILVKDESLLLQLREQVADKLLEIGLQLHTNPKKTRLVDVYSEGLNFVGFRFTKDAIQPRQRNIIKFKQRFKETLKQDALLRHRFRNQQRRLQVLVSKKLNFKILGRPEIPCPNCNLPIDKRPKSWMGYFSVVTDVQQLKSLDKWIRTQIVKHFRDKYDYRIDRKMLRHAQLASIEQEFYRLRKRKICTCPKTVYPSSMGVGMDALDKDITGIG